MGKGAEKEQALGVGREVLSGFPACPLPRAELHMYSVSCREPSRKMLPVAEEKCQRSHGCLRLRNVGPAREGLAHILRNSVMINK